MYATESDLKKRFGAQRIDELKLNHIVEVAEGEEPEPVDVVQVALQDAEEEINGYIGGRYPLPLANVPSNLKRIACDIARYRLYSEQPLEHISVCKTKKPICKFWTSKVKISLMTSPKTSHLPHQ